MDFTEDQRRAIAAPLENLQLIACAGSGKTEVVARRVAHLLGLEPREGQRLLPRNIVAFTFTDKAAAELKDRINLRCRETLGDVLGLAEMFVGTIHAFCLDLLMTEVPVFLKFDVLNEVQQNVLIDRNSKASGLTITLDLSGKPLRRYLDTQHYAMALSILREGNLDNKVLAGTSIIDGLEKYQQLLHTKRYFDYTSILEEAAKALEHNARLRERLADRIRCVIVDEYQDVNPVQERIIRLLHDLGAKICVVGDDDQTIYQWRGSNLQNILTFQERYPDVEQVRLQENFRSSEAIVRVARDFIAQDQERLPKEMKPTGAQSFEDGDLVARSFPDPQKEGEFIAQTILQLRGTAFRDGPVSVPRGLSFSDMAVLLRSVAKNGKAVTDALRSAGVPFIVVGMSDLFQTAEAEAARQLFYFLASREGADPTTLRAAWEAADVGAKPADLKAAIADAEKARAVIVSGKEERFGVYNLQRTFMSFLERIKLTEEKVLGRRRAPAPERRWSSTIWASLANSSLISKPYTTSQIQNGSTRSSWASSSTKPKITTLRAGRRTGTANPDAVRILTVHQAKGMQFPAVFVPALIDHRFPSQRWGGRGGWHILPRSAVRDQAEI